MHTVDESIITDLMAIANQIERESVTAGLGQGGFGYCLMAASNLMVVSARKDMAESVRRIIAEPGQLFPADCTVDEVTDAFSLILDEAKGRLAALGYKFEIQPTDDDKMALVAVPDGPQPQAESLKAHGDAVLPPENTLPTGPKPENPSPQG